MLKNKIGILLICMLLLTFAIPASGILIEPNKTSLLVQDPNQESRMKNQYLNDGRLPPDPSSHD